MAALFEVDVQMLRLVVSLHEVPFNSMVCASE